MPERLIFLHVCTVRVVYSATRKKLKSRSGDTIKLKELLDEGVERCTEKLKEKERQKVDVLASRNPWGELG